jgi:molybdopterin converting factor small subunit
MMETRILFFGQLTDITGTSSVVFDTTGIGDTDQLKEKLYQIYPALRNSKYIIAIDKEVIAQTVKFKPGAAIAFLPPFSGG